MNVYCVMCFNPSRSAVCGHFVGREAPQSIINTYLRCISQLCFRQCLFDDVHCVCCLWRGNRFRKVTEKLQTGTPESRGRFCSFSVFFWDCFLIIRRPPRPKECHLQTTQESHSASKVPPKSYRKVTDRHPRIKKPFL